MTAKAKTNNSKLIIRNPMPIENIYLKIPIEFIIISANIASAEMTREIINIGLLLHYHL
jgi:hypothetical protein